MRCWHFWRKRVPHTFLCYRCRIKLARRNYALKLERNGGER